MKPTYTFKFTPELVWSIIYIAVGALYTAVQAEGQGPPSDWGAWALIVLMAIVRPIGGLIVQGLFGKSPTPTTAPTTISELTSGPPAPPRAAKKGRQ